MIYVKESTTIPGAFQECESQEATHVAMDEGTYLEKRRAYEDSIRQYIDSAYFLSDAESTTQDTEEERNMQQLRETLREAASQLRKNIHKYEKLVADNSGWL